VDGALILETSVLVDLDRERRRNQPGRAHEALGCHPDDRLHITATIAGEIAAGASMERKEQWQAFLGSFPWLPIDEAVAWHFGEASRYLRRNGKLIGTNDLWIAAASLAHDVPLVTRNGTEFNRVPGLRVIAYA
jgi:tRNA(fMet)-specific endonuclease VapC